MGWRLPPWLPPDGPNAPLFRALEEALPADADEAAREVLDLNRAEGAWLDLHGSLYGIVRLPHEDDETYRNRIFAAFLPRNTLEAIRRALQRAYGPSARVEEFPTTDEGTGRVYPVADGSVDASLRFWPPAQSDDAGAARIRVYVRGKWLQPGQPDPVLEAVRPAGVVPDVVIAFPYETPRAEVALSSWGFTGATAGERRVADGYLAFTYAQEGALAAEWLGSTSALFPVADGSVNAGG